MIFLILLGLGLEILRLPQDLVFTDDSDSLLIVCACLYILIEMKYDIFDEPKGNILSKIHIFGK